MCAPPPSRLLRLCSIVLAINPPHAAQQVVCSNMYTVAQIQTRRRHTLSNRSEGYNVHIRDIRSRSHLYAVKRDIQTIPSRTFSAHIMRMPPSYLTVIIAYMLRFICSLVRVFLSAVYIFSFANKRDTRPGSAAHIFTASPRIIFYFTVMRLCTMYGKEKHLRRLRQYFLGGGDSVMRFIYGT